MTTKKQKGKNVASKNTVHFADKFDQNCRYQLKKLNQSIATYADNGEIGNFMKLVSGNRKMLIQPRALKKYAERIINNCPMDENLPAEMFTIITPDYDFGINDFANQSNLRERLKKQVKYWLNGFDYIATVAFDFFPNAKYGNNGMVVSPHIHGIFFNTISKRNREKISRKIKQSIVGKGVLRPFVIKKYDQLIDAVHYAFKGPFGGKDFYKINHGGRKVKRIRTHLSLKDYFDVVSNFKDVRIDRFAFAGGKGISVLKKVRKDMGNVR